jgi:hypothetical protein
MYRTLNAFNTWLAQEIPWRKMPYYIVVGALALYAIPQFGVHALNMSGYALSRCTTIAIADAPSFTIFWTDHFPVFLREELETRAPLFVAAFIPPLVIPGMILFSVMFAMTHCDWTNIAGQGLAGIILSIMFLKSGGMQRNIFKGLKGLLASTSTHTLFMFGLWVYSRF